MDIFSVKSHIVKSEEVMALFIEASEELNEKDLSVKVIYKNGTSALPLWDIALIKENRKKIEVQSAININGKTMIKIPPTFGNHFRFNGKNFFAIKASGDYLVLNKQIGELRTGSIIEEVSPSHEYELNIKNINSALVSKVNLTLKVGNERKDCSYSV